MTVPHANLLLDVLPSAERAMLLACSEPVPLPVKTVLFEAEGTPRYLYFITSGLASVVTAMEGGESVEVSLLGREALPGCTLLLGPLTGPSQCFMQVAGSGLRIEFQKMKQAFGERVEIRGRILQFVQSDFFTQSQLLACNRVHEVEERLARWLLMASDRLGDVNLPLTQQFLGEMLGVQRPTVSVVAGSLQRAGWIEYRHGQVKILNREGLAGAACECYRSTQKFFDKLYKQRD